MEFKIINRIAYQVLSDVKYSPFLKDGMESDTIALNGSDVVLLRDHDYTRYLWTVQDIKDEIDNINGSTKWRNEERRIKTLKYYRDILNIMVGYQREQVIDHVLRKEEDYNLDPLCYAC